ncbi:MAG: phage portal protein [Victivallaceae bacterium]|nr:phage portal protein [Victivallaceae bacterium]
MKPEGKYLYYPDGRRMEIKASPRPAFQARRISSWNRQVTARFDAAQTTHDNRRHWAAADYLSADMEASPEVRRRLRARSRYEVANNSYAKGLELMLANDCIGTGPRLQMLTPDEDFNDEIEVEFMMWTEAVKLPAKLRTMRMARCQDGEAFAVMSTNPKVRHEVKLDLMLIEADRICSDLIWLPDDKSVDGISFDAWGNPAAYRVLKYHPGDTQYYALGDEAVTVPSDYMLHIFRQDRPGLHRGVPELAPALPLFAQLRDYNLAVLSAAQAAADFAAILYTDAPPNGEADEVDPMALIALERNMLLTMPGGWKMDQLDPKQPASSHAEFVKVILSEIARCVCSTYGSVAGDFSGFNYASGRLDNQIYHKSILVDRSFWQTEILNRVFDIWIREYMLSRPFSVGSWTRIPRYPRHGWYWDAFVHVDPTKETKAQTSRLENHTTTLAAECAKDGHDYLAVLRQRSKELRMMRELQIPFNDDNASQNINPEPKENGSEQKEMANE